MNNICKVSKKWYNFYAILCTETTFNADTYNNAKKYLTIGLFCYIILDETFAIR